MTRDETRERWRTASMEAIEAEDAADRLREGRKIFLAELVSTLLEQNEGKKLTQIAAERIALTSYAYQDFIEKMHDARKLAAHARLKAEDLDRRYWAGVSSEATYRAEMKMTGAA